MRSLASVLDGVPRPDRGEHHAAVRPVATEPTRRRGSASLSRPAPSWPVASGAVGVSGASVPAAGGTLLLAEPAGGWSASVNGHALTPVASPAGSWAQAFRLPPGGGHADDQPNALLHDLVTPWNCWRSWWWPRWRCRASGPLRRWRPRPQGRTVQPALTARRACGPAAKPTLLTRTRPASQRLSARACRKVRLPRPLCWRSWGSAPPWPRDRLRQLRQVPAPGLAGLGEAAELPRAPGAGATVRCAARASGAAPVLAVAR